MRWPLLPVILLLSWSLSFADESDSSASSCSPRYVFKSLFLNSDAFSDGRAPVLLRVGQSTLVDKEIANESSIFHDIFRIVKNYDGVRGVKQMAISDGTFHVNAMFYSQERTLVVKINSLGVSGIELGKNPKRAGAEFLKLTGSLLRGIDENQLRFPDRYDYVRVIGSQIVNKKLARSLQELGFHTARENWFKDSVSGLFGYSKGTIVKAASVTGEIKMSSANPGKVFVMMPLMTSSMKKGISLIKLVSGKGSGKTWVLEIPLRPKPE